MATTDEVMRRGDAHASAQFDNIEQLIVWLVHRSLEGGLSTNKKK